MKTIRATFQDALITHAVLPPHEPSGFVSKTLRPTIGVSFSAHRRAVWAPGDAAAVEADIAPGAAFLATSRDLLWLRVREPSEALEIHPDAALVAAVAEDLGASRPASLPDLAAANDPVIWSVAAAFRAAMLGGCGLAPLAVEARLRLLLGHALQTYAGLVVKSRFTGGLDPRRLARVTTLVEERIGETLRLEDLADAAALSPFHFLRAFRRTTGLTPQAYVRARRMERAFWLLSETTLPLKKVAAETGYASMAHFRRAFAAHFGRLPGAVRREAHMRAPHDASA